MWFWRKKKAPVPAQEHLDAALRLAAEGRQEEAVQEFEGSLSHEPDWRVTRLAYGALLSDLGRYDDALIQFHHLLKLDPQDAEPVYRIGEVYALAGKREWAIAQYRQALLRAPEHALARQRLSDLTAEHIAFSVDGGSRRDQQAWALAEFKQAKATLKKQRSLGYQIGRLFKRQS